MMRTLLQRILPKGQFIRSVAVLAGGTGIAQGITVVSSPLLTRLYTPEDFGVLAVYISILSVLLVVASLRYGKAIPLPEDDRTASSLMTLSLLVVVGMSCLLSLCLWFFGSQLVSWVNTPGLASYLWLLSLGFLGAGVYEVLYFWALRKKAFSHIAQTKLSQSLGQVLTQLGLGIFNPNPFGLLLGNIVGQVGGSGTLARQAWKQNSQIFKEVNIQSLLLVASRYRRFPLLSSGAALLNSFGLQLPLLLIASAYGAEVMGWLALGQRLMSIPLTLIGVAVSDVYISESAKAVNRYPEQMNKLLLKTLGTMVVISLPYTGLLAIFAPKIFTIVFGSEWAEAGVYAQILALMFLLQSIANPTGGTLDVLERQDLHMLREVIRIILVSGAVIISTTISSKPIIAIALFSGAGSLAYIIYGYISFHAIRVRMQKI